MGSATVQAFIVLLQEKGKRNMELAERLQDRQSAHLKELTQKDNTILSLEAVGEHLDLDAMRGVMDQRSVAIGKFMTELIEMAKEHSEETQQVDEGMRVIEDVFKKWQQESEEEQVRKEFEASVKPLRDLHKVMIEQCTSIQDSVEKVIKAEEERSADLKRRFKSMQLDAKAAGDPLEEQKH